MKAAVISRPGGPEALELREVQTPEPGTSEVLVRVRASALNRADLLQREGKYPAPPGVPADIPGLEFAGEVARLGSGAARWRPGQRVFGIVGGGAHAQFVMTHEDALAEIPTNLDWEQAAAVPEAFITAHDALRQAEFEPGGTALIHSVGSGVGLAAVQLVRAFGGVPYGTSRTPGKLKLAGGFGLEAGLLTADGLSGLVAFGKEHTGDRGFDVCLDLAGGPYIAATIPVMAHQGRIMLIGTVAGGRAELPLGPTLGKRLTLKGTVLRSRPLEEKVAVTRSFAAEVLPLLAEGRVRPVVDRVFPLEEIGDAHRHLAANQAFGKVVLLIPH